MTRKQSSLTLVLPVLLVMLSLIACFQNVPPLETPQTDDPDEPAETEESPEEPSLEPTEEPTDVPTQEPTSEPTATPLGSVLPDADVVKHGPADSTLVQLVDREDLRNGDNLEIDNGGVADVLLANGWQLLLFNKTRLGVELGNAETLQDVILMQEGTVAGRRALEECEEECEVLFPLPGGRSITVYGTTFFVVLDETTGEVIAGNFEGGVELEGGGISLPLAPGTYIRDWLPNQQPDQATQGQIAFTWDDFEAWGRGLDAPANFSDVVCSNDSTFVADITIPDNTEMEPGEAFVKTWQMLNTGTCPWTADYAFAFVEGDRLSHPGLVAVGGRVEPGETLDISVRLVAPDQPGDYRGWWQLTDGEGERFGQTPFVDIVVIDVVSPAPPRLLAPRDQAAFTSERGCPPVELAWSESEDASGIAEYVLEVFIQDGRQWEALEELSLRGSTYTFEADICEVDGTNYTWRVAAVDGAGNVSDYSEPRLFTLTSVDRTPPAAPQLIAPADDATLGSTSGCQTVNFSWSEPDDASGIDGYRIEVDRWNGSTWLSEVRTFTTSRSLTFDPTFCTAVTTTYRWRVRAYDNEGNAGLFSSYRRFTNNDVIG